MDIDKIWKSFGDDMKFVLTSFNPIEKTWKIEYNNNTYHKHVEEDADMEVAAKKMLEWYESLHTYKAAAETLWTMINEISDIAEKCDDGEIKFEECLKKIMHITGYKYDFMNGDSGEFVWNKQYKDAKEKEEPKKPVINEQKIDVPVLQESNQNTAAEPVKEAKLPEDGFPPFCALNTDSLTLMEYWGHDTDGKRIHVIINYMDNYQTKIDSKPINVNPEKVYEISETEFNGYYNEATQTSNAIKSGYGIDDFTKYHVNYTD